MAFDVDRARSETPGCNHVVHFNNAGASLMPKPVLQAVIEHLSLEAEIGGYEAAETALDRTQRAYDSIAKLINARRQEIAIVENATRAWDMAFYAIPFRQGDRILTSMSEYASNFIAYLQVARKTGAVVEVVPSDESGQLSVSYLKDLLDKRVKLISLTHVPTNGGLINPAIEVGDIAKEFNCLYLLDACQSIGQMPVDVGRIGCHMLAATGRKFLRGPRGTGFLYVQSDLIKELEPPFLDLHAARWTHSDDYQILEDARRFENWEYYVAGKVGLAAAVDYAMEWGLDAIWERISWLADYLRESLMLLPGVQVRDLGSNRCAIVSFTAEGIHPETIRMELKNKRINVSVSPAEYTLLDMKDRQLSEGLVRASVHYFNTTKEIEHLCAVIKSML
jgi:cysteine desulfurase/selenocysteine lyase